MSLKWFKDLGISNFGIKAIKFALKATKTCHEDLEYLTTFSKSSHRKLKRSRQNLVRSPSRLQLLSFLNYVGLRVIFPQLLLPLDDHCLINQETWKKVCNIENGIHGLIRINIEQVLEVWGPFYYNILEIYGFEMILSIYGPNGIDGLPLVFKSLKKNQCFHKPLVATKLNSSFSNVFLHVRQYFFQPTLWILIHPSNGVLMAPILLH